MTTETYQVEFDITDIKVSEGAGKRGHWRLHALRGQDTPTYSGFSVGQNPVEGLADLKTGDYVVLQIQDDNTGKYHNILKILDIAVPTVGGTGKSNGDKVETPQKTTTTPNSRVREMNRSVSLSYAKDMAVAGKLGRDEILVWADKFVEWLSK